MRHPRQRRRILIGVVVALLVIAAGVVYLTVFRDTADEDKAGASVRKETISVNGVELAAEVFTPRDVAHPPLVVMPGSFRGSAEAYRELGLRLARSGYQVVTYGQRGFGGSTGDVDMAGEATQRDAREVITWALDHTQADPDRVAMFGLSYGAGISLLTAAHDPRVRAVAALSAWTNFADAFMDYATPHTIPLRTLLGGANNTSSYDDTVQGLQDTLLDEPAELGPVLRAMSPVRSPDSYIKELNENDPAILIANAFQDSYFAPSQLLPFFDRLKTPKRLELAPGDHGAPAGGSLAGDASGVVDDAVAWFDHYLRGVDNGIDTEDPIVVEDGRTGELRTFKSWPELTKKQRVPLSEPGLTPTSGEPSTWTASLTSGTDSGADSGAIQLSTTAQYKPATARVSSFTSKTTFTWSSPPLQVGLRMAGTPSLTLNIAASAPRATLFVYMYDVAADGIGRLIDLQPYTVTGLRQEEAKQITIALQPMAWSVPAGNHVSLVIDTVDPRFLSLTPADTTITVSSDKKHPASFSLPAD